MENVSIGRIFRIASGSIFLRKIGGKNVTTSEFTLKTKRKKAQIGS